MRKPIVLLPYATFALLNAAQMASADQSSGPLTNASQVLALSADEASRGVKISVKGVVTAAEPDWGGRFFIQDSSGGVFVENISNVQPSPGDVLAISGVSYPGGYAPIISKPHWEKTGTAPLPAAKPVAIEQLMSGAEDSQRIEISGIVRSTQLSGATLEFELVSGGYRIHVYEPIPPGVEPQSLIGAKVRVSGTAATAYNAPLRHLIAVDVYVPFPSDCVVEKPAASDPFAEPVSFINEIGQYQAGRSLGYRIHVKGVVTYQRKGQDVFIRDSTGGLQIKSGQLLSLSPGDMIEAVGFPGVENFLPVLEDAVFRKRGEAHTVVLPKDVPIGELLMGLHHADFITLKGRLLDRLAEMVPSPASESNIVKTTLVLQTTNLLFTAEAETVNPDPALTSIPLGSSVQVNGICFLQSEANGTIKSFQVLLPGSNDVSIIAKPGWLTAQHLLIILAITLILITIGASWIIMVSKRNSALRHLIHERELDQQELQKAHDTLEERVKERTQQLKFQITARKETEVQSKAILAERTRLAKELHDTLEQTLTGITLQLNTVAKLFQQNPETAGYHLGLVRNMLRMSRVELRRSIWDLRSRELEEFDLSKALLISGNRIGDGAGIRLEVVTRGDIHPLPEVVEENLLRIGQEAITNTVKHSGATWAKIQLEFAAHHVALEIRDNGSGFIPENCAGPSDGHFGLLGMSERVKRLSGKILISSAPGKGTTIRVELPAGETPVPRSAHDQADYEENITDSDSYR
ncbi:MAG TPA: histidine kinase [Candidatus Sulfopaludibacter sp.]|nr:histidine kinase [Candidatus Sulfopaludibacter sp.]